MNTATRPDAPLARSLWLPALGLLALAALALSVALPLATYTLSLAAFGLAHVLSELRYVDRRFSPRLGRRLRWSFALLLTAVIALRGGRYLGWLEGPSAVTAELVVVAALTASVLPDLVRARNGSVLAGVALTAALFTGLALSPIHTLLLLAILHNATPLGFLAELLEGRARRVALTAGGLAFIGLPLLIATGLPFEAMRAAGWIAPEANLIPAGPLFDHLGAYLHRDLWTRPWAFHAFCAFVFMQCMHYLAVIHVLPRLQGAAEHAPATLPWPRQRLFLLALVLLSAGLFTHFYFSFKEARALYGIAAAVHAWVELPLLLLALAPSAQVPDEQPDPE